MELIVRGARLSDRNGLVDIGIDAGRIVVIAPRIAGPAPRELAADGRVVVPGLVDAHFHLDKALLLTRAPRPARTVGEAIEITAEMKRVFTVEDIAARARTALEMAIRHGTTAMRAHVEVDPILGLRSLEAMLALRDEYAWAIDLQLCIFPQEGIFQTPGTEALLRRALETGGDAIGGVPYNDTDARRHIELVFDLAETYDQDVDFHLDFGDEPERLHVREVCEQTIRRGLEGRVVVGHETELGALDPDALAPIAARMRDAGVSVLVLPASDLYFTGRNDAKNVRRGLAPIRRLLDAGVNVAVATNNVQNLFTPYGDADLLRLANLAANLSHMGTPDELRLALALVTDNAARALRLRDYGLREGGRADLLILDCADPALAVAAIPERLVVVKGGEVSVRNRVETTFRAKS